MIEQGIKQWWMLHLRGVARIASGKKVEGLEQLDKAMDLTLTLKDDKGSPDAVASNDAYQQVLDSFAQIFAR